MENKEQPNQISWTPAQQLVLDTVDKNMLVSASAGSGKTTIMIARILKLIADFKVPITNFLVVTFTKASAFDMKQKLIEKLKESSDEFVRSQISNVEVSDISNLHSFCSRLISTYFYEIGIDPAYTIIDADQEAHLSEKALKKLFEKHEQEADESFFEVYKIFNNKRNAKDLKSIILKLNKLAKVRLDGFDGLFKILKQTHEIDLSKNICVSEINDRVCKKIATFAKKVEDFATRCLNFDEPKLYDHFVNLATSLKAINARNSFFVNAKNVYDFSFEKTPSPKEQKFLSDEAKDLKEQIKKYIAKSKTFFVSENTEKIQQGLLFSERIIENLLNLSQEFDAIYRKMKTDICGLDFNDLEECALKILGSEEIAEEIRQKYKYVFVDEYQDINEIQEKIITLVSSENNRFMVGDVKQSIYGFRLCDPDMFTEKYELYERENKNNKLIKLNDNFRSAEGILNFVNAIFAGVMTKDFGNIDYASDSMLVAGKKGEDADKCVEICVIKKQKVKRDQEIAHGVYSVLNHMQLEDEEIVKARKEAKVVAEKINELKEKYPLSKMAILVARRNAICDEIIDVLLSQNIKVSSDKTYNLLDRPYINQVVNFAKFCVNQNDDFVLFKTLKSELFGFSDEELIALRLTDKSVRFYQTIENIQSIEDENLRRKFDDFLVKTKKFAGYAKLYSMKKFVKIVIEEFKLRELAYTHLDGEQRNDDFDKFLALLPEINVFEFCLNYEESAFMQQNISGGDSVQMMTVHGSKGMEFDVVFVMNINDKLNLSSLNEKVVFNKKYGLATNFYDQDSRMVETTLPRVLVSIDEEKKLLEEQQRLLYVALTRAKKKLFVVCSADLDKLSPSFPENPTSFFDWFRPLIYENVNGKEFEFCNFKYYDFNAWNENIKKEKNTLKIEKKDKKIEPKWFEYVHADCKDIPLKNSVSKILSLSDEHEIKQFDEQASGQISSADRGTAYHKVLSFVDMHNLSDIQEQLDEICAEKLDENERLLIDKSKIKSVLSDNIFLSIKDSDKILQEREFYAAVPAKLLKNGASGEFILQGIIDLVIIKANEIILVDYKTGKANPEKLKHYKFQLETYEDVLKKIYNPEKIRKFLIFIDEQKNIEI